MLSEELPLNAVFEEEFRDARSVNPETGNPKLQTLHPYTYTLLPKP